MEETPSKERALRDRLAHQRVATLAGFAAARVSIEQINGAVYPEGMSDQDIARFRATAEECHQQAERAISLLDKESWLGLAGEWIKLAQEAEQRRGRQ